MYGDKLSDGQKSEELGELLGFEPASLMIKKLDWDGLDMLNVKMIMTGSSVLWHEKLKELDREDAPKKTWWDCAKDGMENVGLSQKDAQFRNKWRQEN